MSIQINLLPWRYAYRRQQLIQFMFMFGVGIFIVLFVLSCTHLIYQKQINDKRSENELIKSEVLQLDAQIFSIKRLQKEKLRLINRIRAIQILQKNRSKTVRLLEDVARSVPSGLHLEQLIREDDIVIIDGSAESNSNVAQFMRNIGKTFELKDPVLSVIKTNEAEPGRLIEFNLMARQPGLMIDLDNVGAQ